jgi:hypothetical protein
LLIAKADQLERLSATQNGELCTGSLDYVSFTLGEEIFQNALPDQPDYRGQIASDTLNRSLTASLNFCL